MNDRRIAKLPLTARRANVSIDAALPHFDAALQAVAFLSQAAGLPLHYRFRPSPNGPVSQELRRDLAAFREQPQRCKNFTTAASSSPATASTSTRSHASN